MFIELKGKRENANREMIQGFYDTFEDLFMKRYGKILVRNVFTSGSTQRDIIGTTQSFINLKQVACHHSWGNNGKFIFQIDLLYFVYILKNKEYLYGIGFQYENSTVKINSAKNPYIDSKKDEISDIIPIFEKYSYGNSYFNHRIGYPKTHAYISITRKDNKLAQYNTIELCYKLFEILENSIDLINNIKKDIKNIGGKFLKYYAITKNVE